MAGFGLRCELGAGGSQSLGGGNGGRSRSPSGVARAPRSSLSDAKEHVSLSPNAGLGDFPELSGAPGPLPASHSPETLPGGVCMGTALLSGGTPCRSPAAGAEPP